MIPWKVSSDSLLRGSALEEGKSYEEKVYDFFSCLYSCITPFGGATEMSLICLPSKII